LAGLRRPEAFREVVRDMIDADRPASCRRLAERHRLDKTTVWRWRMHILAVLEQATGALGGVVEADQTTRRESRKGSREWVRHAHEPQTCPKPPRPTWRARPRATGAATACPCRSAPAGGGWRWSSAPGADAHGG
jgi:hypothetical protein